MHDPKFQFGDDDTIYRREDCTRLPDDEPVLLLRGKDEAAVFAIREYIRVMLLFPGSANAAAHARSAQAQLNAIEAWQAANPGLVGMGCGNDARRETFAFLASEG